MLKSKECKQHEEIVARYFASVIERQNFLKNCFKICPRCGSIIAIDAKGCGTCLLQFERRNKKKSRR